MTPLIKYISILQDKAKTEKRKLQTAFGKFIKARLDQHPDTNGTLFDSSKYYSIVSRIRGPDDNDKTSNYEPSKESQELMETEQNTKPPPKQDLRGRFNKKMFREVKRTQQRKKTDELMAMVKAFVKKEEIDFIETICFLGQRYCHTTPGKRPLIPVFKNIAKDQEKYTQPNSMDLFEALALKQTLDQSLRSYHRMRLFCQEKLVMPIRDKISDFAKSLTPVARFVKKVGRKLAHFCRNVGNLF